MINCLTDWVGLKAVQETTNSGRYINEVPGITTNQFESTRDLNEDDGDLTAWRTLESRTIFAFEVDLMVKLRKFFKNYTHISSGLTGYVDDNTVANHGSGKYAGWLFDMRTYSPALKLEVNDIRIHLVSAQDFNVKIFDANTGEELYTKAVTGIAGLQTVKINQEYAVYDHNKLFVAYDTVIPYRISNDPKVPGTLSEGSISTASTVIAENIAATETGMSVAYNVKCGIDQFVCQRMTLFTEVYMYRLAIEMLMTSKYSDVINRYTLLDLDEKEKLIQEYRAEYQMQLKGIFDDLTIPDDGICFICEKEINKRVLIP